jgi:predicted MFS family arabinose efflux permease
MVEIGAALSTTVGGVLIQRLSYRASFLGLSGVALIAFLLMWWLIPETLSLTVRNPRVDGELGAMSEGEGFAQ